MKRIAKKTAEQVARQLERIFTLHYSHGCGSDALYEKADKIGYRFVAGMAY